MKTIHPRLHYSSLRVFTSLLVSLVLLVTPLVPLAAASARTGGAAVNASALAGAALAPATTVVAATKTDSFPDPDGDGKAEPGQTITYDVNVANSGAVDATGVNFSDTIDPNTTLVPGSLRVSPLAFADSYSATINTPLSISAPGVLANDTGTPAPTAQPIAAGPTSQGGTVTLNADGSFSYTPPNATFQGADTFSYTATNGTTPTDSATVTINVDDSPAVTTTSPTNGANSVAPNSNITINFTEPVNATTGSFSVECPTGSPQTFTLSASPSASFTLDPTADLPAGTTCTVKVFAAGITDADNFDPPDNMAADYTFSFGVKPVAVDDMRSATGNVRINTTTTGYSVLANDLAPGATITAFDPTSANGGEVTMNTSTGTFTYNPPRGFTGTDSFNYTITNGGGSDTGTVVLTVTDTIWFINNSAGSCASGCGRLTSPYNSLAAFEAVNGNGGAGDPAAGDSIFIYTGSGNYTAPLTLENNQIVVGQGAAGALTGLGSLTGITAAPDSDPLPSTGGTAPVITSVVTSGAAFRLAQNNHLHGLAFNDTDGAAISGTSNIGAFLFSEIAVDNSAGGAPGISLTGGGSVTSTGVNTITTGTGTALNVVSTDIAATGLTFKSISAGTASAGPANGIVLNTTGSLGGLTVTGDGNTSLGGNDSGGTIQKTTAEGVLLNNTTSPSFTNLKIANTTKDGILGTRVTNFTFKNGKVDTTGTDAVANESNISFRGDLTGANANLSGAVSITGNVLNNAFYHGVDIQNYTGTISSADISGNSLTSSTATASSLGAAIRLIAFGTATSHADVTKGDINNNVIQNFPSSDGIQVNTGNATIPAAAGTTMGQAGSATNIINITGNRIAGASAANKLGGNAIVVSARGTGQANVNIDGNGTAANPITNIAGIGISFGGFGLLNMTGTINNNKLVNLGNIFASPGINIGLDRHFAVTDNGTMSVAVTNNTVSGEDGNGILVVARNSAATINATVKANTVSAPASGVRQGIRVDSGTTNGNTNVCLDILNNTSAGSGGATGIGLRKQGTNAAVNVYGIEGMVATSSPGVESFVDGQNPSGGGTTLISAASGFSNCSSAPNVASLGTSPQGFGNAEVAALFAQASVTGEAVADASNATAASEPRVWSDMPASSESAAVRSATTDDAAYVGVLGSADRTVRMVKASYEPSRTHSTRTNAGTKKTTAYAPSAAATLFSGETVNHNVGTLPAGKTVHIVFQVTVDNPFPTGVTQVANQGTVSGDNFTTVSTDDPAAGGSADPTVTQILTPPTISVKDATVAEPATGSAPAAFAVTLSHSYTHTVTVDYTTAPDTGGANPATAGSDYTATSGTLTFNPGETVQTISVPVLADGDATETAETFLVNLSNNSSNSSIADGQAVGTITPESTPGTVIISELRTSGPAGADDDFVELYNNTDSPITVAASDASGGWALVKSGSTCGSTPVVVAVIPAGTVIPARGNYLLTGSAYSLGAYAAGDQSLVFNIENDGNVALFNTADLSNVSTVTRLDAVGFGSNTGGNCDLLREGSTLTPAAGSAAEYSFVRSVDKGATKDTNDNASDFIVVSTTGGAVGSNTSSTLGAPGPENSTGARGPVPCDVTDTAKFGRARLDSTAALGSAPNTVRDATVVPNGASGTIAFSRRFTNNTGGNVTRLRFRITNTLNPATTVGAADLRALSATTNVVSVNDPATCGGPAPCNVTVIGTTLEQPPTQGSGGGVNSTLDVGSVSSATPLLPGASVNVRLLMGVQTAGKYHLSIVVETATAGSIGQDEWELRGNTEDGGASASEGGCNTPPVANAGADQTIECGGASTSVTLDGTGSTDADGDTLTYEWREGATVLGTTAVLNTSLAFGPHTITLKVTDPSGDFSEDTVSINIVDTTDPMITAPPNVTVNTGPGASSCGAFVSDATLGTPTASDGCSASVTVTRSGVPSGNNFPVGTTIVTYTADDGHGHTKNAYQSVTVNDNTPPTITAPANIVTNAPANSCSVSLDPGTPTVGDNCPGATYAGARSDMQPLNAPYPVGTTTITWTATDAHGNSATATQTVTVKDVTPPTITLTTGTIELAPPNHQYATFSVSAFVASASDGCDASVDINDVVISQATSDEPEDAAGNGDGNTLNDIVIAPDCKSLQLRSERSGGGDGRVYTITLKVKDSSGNVATAVRKVFVPKTGPAIDSGVQYVVNGCTP
ncbi:MAG TPA: Ig-like domain-containing protein [Pyrinomonadaceae bacterium]|nr:Ig-like domain-containing protein [Pyrinomonadaceae bacterium]